jgi:hypothetical protein
MLGNASVAWMESDELEGLPAEAQAFHRRARIVDATVREIAERGYGQTVYMGTMWAASNSAATHSWHETTSTLTLT